jgi:hypothetical protein
MKISNHYILIILITINLLNPFTLHAESQNNSYELLSQCFGKIRPSEESAIRPLFDKITRNTNPELSKTDIKLLKNWIETQQTNLELIDYALEANTLKFPPIDIASLELPMFQEYRSILGLKLIQVKIFLSENKYNAAIAHILEAVKLGRLVRHGEKSSILHYTIGVALEGQSIQWLQEILCIAKHNNRTLGQILGVIHHEEIPDEAFIASLRDELNNFVIPSIEYYSGQIEPILEELKMNGEHIYDKNDSINISKKQFQQIIHNAEKPWSKRAVDTITEDNPDELYDEFEDYLGLFACNDNDELNVKLEKDTAKWKELDSRARGKKNVLGRILLTSLSSLESFHKRSVALRTKNNITRTLVALKIFQNNYGHYPAELTQLVETEIITKIPLDLFSNQQLNYSLPASKLWSIGSDGKDNKGDQENDISFSCPSIK